MSLIVPANAAIEAMERELIGLPAFARSLDECPLRHAFAPGVYLRTIFMRAGLFIVGHEHKTEHFNMVHFGRARLMVEGEAVIIEGPCGFVSKPGSRKILFIEEDMQYSTIHPTTETDIEKIEAEMVNKSTAYLTYHADLKQLNLREP